MSYKPFFISLVDATNTPILIHVPNDEAQDMDKVLKYNVFSNLSLDYFESQLFDNTALETNPMIKLFFQLEGVAVYGTIVKSTALKIIVGLQEIDTDEKQVNEIFQKVKKLYLRVKCNPFVDTNKNDNDDDDNNLIVQKLEEKFAIEFGS